MVTAVNPDATSAMAGGKKLASKVLSKGLSFGLPALFAIPEISKTYNAGKSSDKAKTEEKYDWGAMLKQLPKSAVNFGKWFAVPAIIAGIFNPVGVLACSAVALAGFVVPSLIPDIGEEEEEQAQQERITYA